MDTEKIIQDLNRRFDAPLPEFYKRRIIFWHDDDGEFEEQLDSIELTNAKLIKATGSNYFEIKKLLAIDDTSNNFLVYVPFEVKDEENWLINFELYSEQFRADLNTIWMDEMGLPSSPVLRGQIKQYHKFFNNKERRAKVSALVGNISTASQLHLAIMAVICGLKDVSPNGIIRTVIEGGLDTDTNKLYQSIVNFGAQSAFMALVRQATGYTCEEKLSIAGLSSHILITAATRTICKEYLQGLDSFISIPHQSYCYDSWW